LKKVKGIEKGAHGIKGDEHTKLSKQWKDYRGKDKLAASYEQVELEENPATWREMMKKLAVKGGYSPTSNNGYEAIDDYRNGLGKFEKQGKKSIKQVQDWIYRSGYKINPEALKDILGEEVELEEGYENNMVTHLGELGIDVSFRLGKMIVHKSDLQRIKDALKDGIADRGSVIWNHRMPEFKFMGEEVNEVSPPGWEGSVKAMKKHKDIDNPYALAWHMKNKGDKPHYKDQDGPPVKKDKYKEEQMEQVTEETANVEKAIQIAKKMGGNHTGAVKEIEKIQKGLSDHPKVSDALRTANESLEEAKDLKEFIRAKGGAVKYDNDKQGWFDKSGKRIYLGKSDTAKLMSKDIQRKIRTGDWITPYDLSKEETDMKKENKYFDTKSGSIEDSIKQMYQLESTEVAVNKAELDKLVKQYIAKGGTVTKLPPALAPDEDPDPKRKAYKIKKVGNTYKILKASLREFVKTYNEHFLTNYAAEEFIEDMQHGYDSKGKSLAPKKEKEEGAMKRGSNLDTYKPKPKDK